MGLRRARQRLNVAYKQAQSNHWMMLALFVMGMCLAVYLLARLYRMGRFVFGRG